MSKKNKTLAEMEELYGPAHYCVYMIMFPNTKVYIGCTGTEPWRRWGVKKQRNKDLMAAYEEFGKNNCDYFILEDSLREEEAYEREKYWIDFYDATNLENGYNSGCGGKKDVHYAERTIERDREKALNRSQESIEKLRLSMPHYPVICVETGRRYETSGLAEKEEKIFASHIRDVCRGLRKTAGGYHWIYA